VQEEEAVAHSKKAALTLAMWKKQYSRAIQEKLHRGVKLDSCDNSSSPKPST
jgi:hypothetical protein